jgi:hypothetical protein
VFLRVRQDPAGTVRNDQRQRSQVEEGQQKTGLPACRLLFACLLLACEEKQ